MRQAALTLAASIEFVPYFDQTVPVMSGEWRLAADYLDLYSSGKAGYIWVVWLFFVEEPAGTRGGPQLDEAIGNRRTFICRTI